MQWWFAAKIPSNQKRGIEPAWITWIYDGLEIENPAIGKEHATYWIDKIDPEPITAVDVPVKPKFKTILETTKIPKLPIT